MNDDKQLNLSEDDFISGEIDLTNEFTPDFSSNNEWPILLVELRDVIYRTLKHNGIDNKKLALDIVLDIGNHIGGFQVYFPRGDKVKRQGRNIKIYDQFKGDNIKSIAYNFQLSAHQIYKIIEQVRANGLKKLGVEEQAWPELLFELRGIVDHTLNNSGIHNKALALTVVLDIGEKIGGVQVYFPRGDKLRKKVRDIDIYEQSKDNHIRKLAHKYHLTDKTIYEIIAKMRNIELKQRQPDLFE